MLSYRQDGEKGYFMLEWKIWGGHRDEFNAIYIWAFCMDDAIEMARRIDPDVCVAQPI